MTFDTFLAAVATEPEIELHSLLALHRGEPVMEAYWEPWGASDRVHVYSASKTVTGAAVGIAIGEGRLSLADRVVDLIPPAGEVHPRLAEVTVHHLLSMSTGHTADPVWRDDLDPAEAFYAAVPQQPVGSVHAYNNLASWMLGEVVRRVTGQTLMAYLGRRLFEPLGIAPTWDADELGRELGLAGLHVTTGDLARIGELFRLGGAWQGRQLVPADYVAAAGTRQIPTGPGPDFDWTTGYGYQVWISREGYRLDGAYGQFCLVLPQRETVIAITSSETTGKQLLLDLVFEHLVPAIEDEGKPTERRLAVEPVGDTGTPGPWWCARPTSLPEDGPAHLREVRVERSGDGWVLSAAADEAPQRVSIPGSGWHHGVVRIADQEVPVAFSIGTDREQARVLIAFTDTVHTLEVVLARGIGTQRWRTMPLGWPGLNELVAR